MRAMKYFVFPFLCVWFVGEAGAEPKTEPNAVPAEDPTARLAAIYTEIDAIYLRRDERDALDEIDRKLAQADELAKDEFRTLWRRARNEFWRSDTASSSDQKAAHGQLGWKIAEQALRVAPGKLEGHYYAAINAGSYGDAIGLAKAFVQGVEEQFLEHLHAALDKSPGFDRGGASLALARYHFKLPWPRRDSDKAVSILRATLKTFPDNLRAKAYLADTLLDDDVEAEAKQLIAEILAAKEGRDPAEDRFAKKMAKTLLLKMNGD